MVKSCGVRSTGFDISPSSRNVVSHNAKLNDVQVEVVDGFSDVTDVYDVVVANILAPVLRDLASEIASRVADRGKVVLAGMRTDQVNEVVAAFGGFSLCDSITIDGWTTVCLSR
jgi:ribosomal protein L11 methyltransferase